MIIVDNELIKETAKTDVVLAMEMLHLHLEVPGIGEGTEMAKVLEYEASIFPEDKYDVEKRTECALKVIEFGLNLIEQSKHRRPIRQSLMRVSNDPVCLVVGKKRKVLRIA